jgi:tRNA pseudouridine13 synthase
MKLKQNPDDFQVEELTDVVPSERGAFAFYRLEKRSWSTPDALAAVRRRWRIEPRRLGYGGLKDKHAATVQYLSIFHGPRRNLEHESIRVTYLGQLVQPYRSSDIRTNRFRIILRDLSPAAVEWAMRAVEEVRVDGLPNYFDDQRFGSVTPGGAFIAKQMVLGQFEDALRLALAAPYEFDRAAQKREKTILRECWGDWAACKAQLPRGHARSLVDYLLHHPGDFRGAVARLRPELRGLYLSAYQSHLWNRMLGCWLRDHLRPEQLIAIRLRLETLPMPRGLDESQRRDLAALTLPLPSARLHLEPSDPLATLVHDALAEEGLELCQLKIKGVRELFFSKGTRAALCLPASLQASEDADERHPKRRKLVLSFELPRGSYATLLVKRISHV